MKPKEEIINKIEGLKRGVMLYNKITETDLKEWYMLNACPRDYQSAFGKIKALDKAISTIKSFMKGYKLVKKSDLLTEEELGQIKAVIKVYTNEKEIIQKLKALARRDR